MPEISNSSLRFTDARNTEEAARVYDIIREKYGEISHLLAIHGYVRRHKRFPTDWTINKYDQKGLTDN